MRRDARSEWTGVCGSGMSFIDGGGLWGGGGAGNGRWLNVERFSVIFVRLVVDGFEAA